MLSILNCETFEIWISFLFTLFFMGVEYCLMLLLFNLDDQLHTMMKSMRSRVGKLSDARKKSGQGADDSMSERDKFIYDNFSFLVTHIVRIPSRQTGKVSLVFFLEVTNTECVKCSCKLN